MQCWKIFEKRVGARLGGVRVGILGGEDVRHPTLSIECTQIDRKRFPKMVKNKYYQAIRNCPKGKMPIVVMKEKRRSDDNALVVISLLNFERILLKAYPELQDESRLR